MWIGIESRHPPQIGYAVTTPDEHQSPDPLTQPSQPPQPLQPPEFVPPQAQPYAQQPPPQFPPQPPQFAPQPPQFAPQPPQVAWQQPLPTMTLPAQPAPPTAASKLRKRLVVAAAVVAVLLVAAGGVGWWYVGEANRTTYSPENVVRSYLTAMQEGDHAKAAQIVAPTAPEDSLDALLDPRFATASNDRIADISIKQTEADGDRASFEAAYSLAGKQYTTVFKASRTGKESFFFDKWEMEAPLLATVKLAADGLPLTVNGVDFTPDAAAKTYALLPGTYVFKVADTQHLKGQEKSVTVPFADSKTKVTAVTLSRTPTDELVADVRAQVAAKMNECAASVTAVLDHAENGCPFFIDPSGDKARSALDDIAPDSMKWKVDTQPEISVTVRNGEIRFQTTKAGKRTYTAGSKRPNYSWSGSGPIRVAGKVDVSGSAVVLVYD